MEYQKKFKVITPPCRFQWLDSNIKLERKIKKDNRKRLVQKARWSKMFSDEMVKERLTRDEIWDKYIEETSNCVKSFNVESEEEETRRRNTLGW